MTPTAWLFAIVAVIFGVGFCVGCFVTWRLVKFVHQTEEL